MREPPGPCGAGRLRCAYAFVAERLWLRVGAGGRRPAREIATRELRSEWSISKPGQALPPPTGTAAGPPVSSTPVEPGVLIIGSACRLEARPGPAAAWPVLLGRAAVCAGGQRPARSPSAPRAALGASSRSPARPCRRPPARRSGPPAPPAPSTPAGPGVLVCCSSFRNLACNSPPALCWFVSVCDGTPLVFVNCMRLLLSAGPAVAHRHRGWAVLTFPVLQADQTGCVRG